MHESWLLDHDYALRELEAAMRSPITTQTQPAGRVAGINLFEKCQYGIYRSHRYRILY
jgi:hypothetical protein